MGKKNCRATVKNAKGRGERKPRKGKLNGEAFRGKTYPMLRLVDLKKVTRKVYCGGNQLLEEVSMVLEQLLQP